MAGIAIIIPNADFSNSPLGKVTKSVSNAELAESYSANYCKSINDYSKKGDVYNLCLTLLNEGLWDRMIGIYPMMGKDLTALSTNLKSPKAFDLKLGANASSASDGIKFTNTIGVGQVVPDVIELEHLGRFGIYGCFSKTAMSPAENAISRMISMRTSNTEALFTCYTGGLGGKFINGSYANVSTSVQGADSKFIKTNFTSQLSENGKAGRVKTSFGEKHTEEQSKAISIKVNNILGFDFIKAASTPTGSLIEATSDIFNGTFHCYAMFDASQEEGNRIYEILKNFMAAVKP